MPEQQLVRPARPFNNGLTFLRLSEDTSTSPRRHLLSARSSVNIQRQNQKNTDDIENGKSKGETTYPDGTPIPPSDFPLHHAPPSTSTAGKARRTSAPSASVLMTPQIRSQRLIGNSNPRYRWEKYYQSAKQLAEMKKPIRKYYERNNYLIQQYLYIDRLLDSSLPQNLLQEYDVDVPTTIQEEHQVGDAPQVDGLEAKTPKPTAVRVKRTKALYKISEDTPLLSHDGTDETGAPPDIPLFQPEDDEDSGARIVTVAIYINFSANTILLILKIIVTILTSSLSVLASLVDAALDFLSTFIVWGTSVLISSGSKDTENFPVGRNRLEPLGVLVFSVIMITSFFQVALQALSVLTSSSTDREPVKLGTAAIIIMATTVGVKFGCWLWCRLIRNSGVQALAQDAMTDVIFNIFSIIFPLIGYFLHIWWLDPLGGLLLSCYVILSWSSTTLTHISNLSGRAATPDERNILLYLTMRFAKSIRYVQGLQAYTSGDKICVEVDIVLDEEMRLRDSHDVQESLQYVLESVPGVERAWVHTDYKRENLPSHMQMS